MTSGSRPLVVILAGGRGQRMGGNKPLFTFEGGSLIGKVIERLRPQGADIRINAGLAGSDLADSLSGLGYPLIHDDNTYAGLGPLSGVHSALQCAREVGLPDVITVACDMPAVPGDFVARLLAAGTEGVNVAYYLGERDYPLCALWSVGQLPHLSQMLTLARPNGGLRVMAYLDSVKVRHISVTDERAFLNINTPGDAACNLPRDGTL